MSQVLVTITQHVADRDQARHLRIRPGRPFYIAAAGGCEVPARNRYLSLKYLSLRTAIPQTDFVVRLPT